MKTTDALIGFAPPGSGSGVEWVQGEYYQTSPTPVASPGVLRLYVDPALRERRLYVAMLMNPTAGNTDYAVGFDVEFYLNGQGVGKLPNTLGANVNALLAHWAPCFFTAQQAGALPNSIIDLVAVNAGQGGWQNGTVVLNPYIVRATCDEVRISIRNVYSVSAFKINFGICSCEI